jgi:PrtD family type I secretion system ABC transporter
MTRIRKSVLGTAIAASRRALIGLVLFSLFLNVLMLAPSLYMMQVYDRVLVTHSTDTLLLLSVIMAVALAVGGLLELVRGRIMLEVGNWMERRVGPAALASSLNLALNGRTAPTPQSLRDLSTVRTFLSGPGAFPLLDAPWAPIYLAVVFVIHPWLGWLATVGALVLFGFGVLNEVITRRPLEEASKASMRAMNNAEAALRNAEVVSAMGLAADITARWQAGVEQNLAGQTKASRRGGEIAALSRFFRLALQSGVLGLGSYLAIRNAMSPGGMIAASILMSRTLAPVEQAISTWRSVLSVRQAYARLQRSLNAAPARTPGTKLPRPRGLLTVEGVTLVPPGAQEPVLRNVSFALQPGEALGVIGASAAGKTSLARLLVGAWVPSRGHVRLDGAEISGWDAVERGPYLGYVPQDVELFDGTVRDNIARFAEAEDHEVIAAAQAAGVHDLILHLPQGYETRIGPGGAALSGGQRQRIALARALFRNPALLIMDEPNASLDTAGERALALAIMTAKQRSATQVVISHRPAILDTMDKLLILNHGTVQDFGPRSEVIARLTAGARAEPGKVVNVPSAQMGGGA